MSLMDIFNGFRGVTPAGPVAASGNPGATPNQNTTIPNGTTPQSDGSLPAIPAAGTGTESPLEGYKDLWTVDPKATAAVTPTSLVPTMNIDNAALMKAAQGLNFAAAIPQDIMEKAAKGDAVALAAAINHAAQASYAQGAAASIAISKKAFTDQATAFETKYVPELMRNQDITRELRNEVSLFSNPAVAPMLSMLESQLKVKFPQATPVEIATHAKTYLSQFANEVITSSGGNVQQKVELEAARRQQPKEQDWEALLGVSS
jgi:hypothetical protein